MLSQTIFPSPFPGLTLKAWALVQFNGVTSTTLIAGVNVASAQRLGVGQHRVTFTTALSGKQQMVATHNVAGGGAYTKQDIGNNGAAAATNDFGTALNGASADITGQGYLAFFDQ